MVNRIRVITLLALGAASCLALQQTFADEAKVDIEIIQSWKGKMREDALKGAAPASGMVTDADSWSVLWKKWRGDEEVPQIDFAKDLVIVTMVNGPNNLNVRRVGRNEKGEVDYVAMSTKVAGPGFGYSFVQISREAVTSVKGQPVPGAKRSGEFVDVTFGGKLQTGVMAIGGETTGTIITAGEITWELDFRRTPKLLPLVKKLDGKLVVVQGRLLKVQGVERGDRWIVSVTALESQ